jgi:hypothetical protein
MAPRAMPNERSLNDITVLRTTIRSTADRVCERRSDIPLLGQGELLDRAPIPTVDFRAGIALMGMGLDCHGEFGISIRATGYWTSLQPGLAQVFLRPFVKGYVPARRHRCHSELRAHSHHYC